MSRRRVRQLRPATTILLLLTTAACGTRYRAEAWPEADAVFDVTAPAGPSDRWNGGDAAYTIALGDGRVLWLFGDTFIGRDRASSRLVRNTVGLQSSDAIRDLSFHWRPDPRGAFFDDGADDHWLWPLHGIVIDTHLIVFLQVVTRTASNAFGFEVTGYKVAAIDDISGSPTTWGMRFIDPPAVARRAGLTVGNALVRDNGNVVALAVREPGDHRGYLVRFPAAALGQGDLSGATWWTGDAREWTATDGDRPEPAAVLNDAGAESSISYDTVREQWLHIKSGSLGSGTIEVATAPFITGPWSSSRTVFTSPEADRRDVFAYAAKGHPELDAGGELAITYVVNAFDLQDTLNDPTIYRPRFVRLFISADMR